MIVGVSENGIAAMMAHSTEDLQYNDGTVPGNLSSLSFKDLSSV
jgi:hypothetical protein